MTAPVLLLDEAAGGLVDRGREEHVARRSAVARGNSAAAEEVVITHVEEIPPGYTHGLLLRGGEVVSAGPIEEVLTAPLLSDAFGLELEVRRERGRYSARRAA